MNVQELIQELSLFPKNATVAFTYDGRVADARLVYESYNGKAALSNGFDLFCCADLIKGIDRKDPRYSRMFDEITQKRHYLNSLKLRLKRARNRKGLFRGKVKAFRPLPGDIDL